MDMQILKYFIEVAKCRNFTKAAEHFYIGQPALSRQISNLEKQVGTQLLIRDTRSVDLTPAGEVLYKEGELLLNHLTSIIEKTRKAGSGSMGALKIATLWSYNRHFLQEIQKFTSLFPNINVEFEHKNLPDMIDSIVYGGIDLGITFKFSISNQDELHWKTISNEEFYVLSSASSHLSTKKSITADELLNECLIIGDYSAPKFINNLISKHKANEIQKDIQKPCIIYATSHESVIVKVGSGLGVSIQPKFVAEAVAQSYGFSITNISDIDTRNEIGFIWRKNNINPTIDNFIKFFSKNKERIAS